MRVWTVALLVLLTFGCAPSGQGTEAFQPNQDIAGEWWALCEAGNCLIGAQDWSPDGLGEETVLRNEAWQAFLGRPASETVPFLMSRLDSITETWIHVCPFGNATEGEMAVYALQHILKANWTECNTTNGTVREAIVLHRTRRQDAVRTVLQNQKARPELKKYFLALYAERTEEASHNSALPAPAHGGLRPNL